MSSGGGTGRGFRDCVGFREGFDPWGFFLPACGRMAVLSTSSRCSTGRISRSFRARFGTSTMSFKFRLGMITVLIPARCAASTFSRTPPTGRTRPRSVTSPVIPTSRRTLRFVKADVSAVATVIPALGPSFGIAPSGICR